MTPEQAAFLVQLYVPMIKQESEITLRVLKAVPEGQDSYRPHPNSRSTLELIWHIAGVDLWFLDGFLNGKFEMEDDSMPADFSSSADIVACYEDEFACRLEKVAILPADFWATPLPFFGLYNHPAVMYLQFMLMHSSHHRGQLCAYLRPMGAKVPNIYGGSFDEPMDQADSK
ncbi:MAG: DinB family protein [Candidatus Acidiferrales bacterium]